MLQAYTKQHLDIRAQLQLLQQRGMIISDIRKAEACLERIGYYRLSGYWYPFRVESEETDRMGKTVIVKQDNFKEGTQFQSVYDLYVFDKRLRILMLDAIERLEVGLRVAIALLLGKRSPTAHRNPSELSSNFTRLNSRGEIPHKKWLEKHDVLALKSKEDFIVHFRSKYSSDLPIWIAIELWDFGLLSVFTYGLKNSDLDVLSKKYSLPRRELLTSWIRSINHIRNICAHHGRLWNRSPVDQPKLPRLGEIPLLDHIASNTVVPLSNNLALIRLYAVAAIIQFFLRTINPNSTWSERLKEHLDSFPNVPHVSVESMGFPKNWSKMPLWS